MDDSPFLIAGGGIAGLAAALGLSRIGKASHILEKALAFEPLGAGVQLGPNAVAALRYLGAWEHVEAQCFSPAEIHVRDGISGAYLQRVKLGKTFEMRFGAPYRVAHRADLHAALLAAVETTRRTDIMLDAGIIDLSPDSAEVTLASGQQLKGAGIIGADGIHSRVREFVNPEAFVADTGRKLFRSLVPARRAPPSVNMEVVTLWLYPGAHVVHYCVRKGQDLNIVASLDATALSPQLAFPDACIALDGVTNADIPWSQWPALAVEPQHGWWRGKAVLTGDAAHASLPYLAQGAAMALEDACVLSQSLSQSAESETAYWVFQQQRKARTEKLQAQSRKAGQVYDAKGVARLGRNAVMSMVPANLVLDRLAWIYNWTP